MIRHHKILLLILFVMVLSCGFICSFIFGINRNGHIITKGDNFTIDRYDGERVFLADGTSLIYWDDVFVIGDCSGTIGNSNDGCQYEIRHGIIDELFLLLKERRYRIYRKKDVVNAIKNELEQGFVIYREENGLFFDQAGSLLNNTFTVNYKTLTSTVHPERTVIRFKYGKVWRIEEFDKSLISHCSFDMNEIIMLYTESGRFTKTYINSEEYYGAGVPHFITNEKNPYIEDTTER